jgi:hypothetical protein
VDRGWSPASADHPDRPDCGVGRDRGHGREDGAKGRDSLATVQGAARASIYTKRDSYRRRIQTLVAAELLLRSVPGHLRPLEASSLASDDVRRAEVRLTAFEVSRRDVAAARERVAR